MNLKIDGKTISDIIIGMSDGLTVPFALAAGLAGAIGYGLQGEALAGAVKGIISNRSGWALFMMKEELGLEQPDPKQALKTALFIGGAYVVGGIVPLAPYAFGLPVQKALYLSIVATCIALLIFGAVKGKFTSVPPLKSALETFLVGSVAAYAAYLLARLVGGY